MHEDNTPDDARTAVVDFEPQLDAVVVVLQPQFRGRALTADTGNADIAVVVRRHGRDRLGGEERQDADSENQHEHTAADPERNEDADHARSLQSRRSGCNGTLVALAKALGRS